jgi:hypothetical protein
MPQGSQFLLTVAAILSARPGWTQNREDVAQDPPVVTVCDVLRAPLKYDGRLVKIRGRWYGTDEGSWLLGDGCPDVLITDGHVWPAGIALTAPGERGILHKIEFAFDEDSEHRFNRAYRRVGKRVPKQCIISTLTGLFETREDWSQHKAVYPNGTSKFIGFGHLD